MNKTYSLIRVSSDRQDFNSQLQGITSFCRDNNIELLEEHIIKEFNVSGFKTPLKEREGLSKVLALAEQQLIDTLIIFNTDRLRKKNGFITIHNKINISKSKNCKCNRRNN